METLPNFESPTCSPPPNLPAHPDPFSRLHVSVSFRDGSSKSFERFFSARSRFETPDQEKAELFRVFQKFDKNGDGRLSVDEIVGSLEKLGIVVAKADLVSLLTTESPPDDESVNFDDFRFLYRSLCNEDASSRGNVSESDLQPAFDLFDKNGDGYISAEELQLVLTNLGFLEARSLAECESMISKVDADGDGRVSFAEFRIMMKSMTE